MVNVRAIQRQANIVGWLLMIPTIIGISLFIIYPVIFSLIMSFTNWKFVFINVSFIGGDNYVWLFSESGRQFWISVWTSIKFTFISTAIQTVLGFFLAYVLYNMKPKAQAVYKVLIYIPVLLPAAVVSVMWTFIFEPNVGLIDVLLTNLGFKNLPLWVADENIALGSVIFVNTWQYLGVTTNHLFHRDERHFARCDRGCHHRRRGKVADSLAVYPAPFVEFHLRQSPAFHHGRFKIFRPVLSVHQRNGRPRAVCGGAVYLAHCLSLQNILPRGHDVDRFVRHHRRDQLNVELAARQNGGQDRCVKMF